MAISKESKFAIKGRLEVVANRLRKIEEELKRADKAVKSLTRQKAVLEASITAMEDDINGSVSRVNR